MIERGAKLGHYEVVAPIGAGGMGEVYRAHDAKLGRDVAIKVLPDSLASDRDLVRRFQQEGRTAGSLNHPNIMAIYDADVDGPVPYVVCELLEGETLRSAIDGGSITPRKAIEYTKQIAYGLSAAHEKGITHRDLKPDNLFVTLGGAIKILDFGLAKVRLPEDESSANSALPTREMVAPVTDAGTVMGTVGYMAPEQVRARAADARADIFALGAILFEMLTGERAFGGDSPVETMNAILKEDPPETPSDDFPPGVELVMRHCLEKQPDQRFQSARDLAFHLESLSTISSGLRALPEASSKTSWWPWVVVGALVAGIAAAAAIGARRDNPPPAFHQLTFRQGEIPAARFAADGESILYSAAWDGLPVELFMTSREGPESRSLGLVDNDLLDVNASGELALLVAPRGNRLFGQLGTLGRASVSGSATREVLEGVVDAGWMTSSDGVDEGDELVVVRNAGLESRLEYPLGNVLYQGAGIISTPRASPDGRRIAFIHHPLLGDDGGSVMVCDVDGETEALSEGWSSVHGLAWTPEGDEIWFSAASEGANRSLHAVTMAGAHRVLYASPASIRIHDIGSDGRALVTRDVQRQEMTALAPGETREHDLSWLDWSIPVGLSADGEELLFNEAGEGGGTDYSVYLRTTDGRSPAVRLGDGLAIGFAADASMAITVTRAAERQLRLVPTGAGAPTLVDTEIDRAFAAILTSGGERLFLAGYAQRYGVRLFEQPLDGGPLRAITPQSIVDTTASPRRSNRGAIDRDGKLVLAPGVEDPWMIYSIDGSEPRPVRTLTADDIVLYWSRDRRYAYAVEGYQAPVDIWKVDIETGRRELWKRVSLQNPAGVGMIGNLVVVAEDDAEAYVMSFMRTLSELYLVDGLR